jgi:hypothetical protein
VVGAAHYPPTRTLITRIDTLAHMLRVLPCHSRNSPVGDNTQSDHSLLIAVTIAAAALIDERGRTRTERDSGS